MLASELLSRTPMRPSSAVYLPLLFVLGAFTSAQADPITVQVGGTLTTVTEGVSGVFPTDTAFSFALTWDPDAAYVVGPLGPSLVYSMPYGVEGTIGDNPLSFSTFDWAEAYGGLYLERDSVLIAGTVRYGPDSSWGIRAMTINLYGWDPPLSNVMPTSIPPNLIGAFTIYLSEVGPPLGDGYRAGTQVGTVSGEITSVQQIPEPGTALLLVAGLPAIFWCQRRSRPRSPPAR
jgi:hypothetical protein